MEREGFRKGLRIRLRGRGEYVIEQRLPDGSLQVRDIISNEYKSLEEQFLIKALFDGGMEILGDERGLNGAGRADTGLAVRDLSLLDEDLKGRTKRRYAYVDKIYARKITKLTRETLEPLIEKVSLEIRDPSPPSWVTLYRWVRRYEASGRDVRVLVPGYRRRGNRRRKFSGGDSEKAEAVVNIIDKVIAEKYLTRRRHTVESVFESVCARIASENQFRNSDDRLSFPHRSSIHDVVNRLDHYEVMKARFGRRIADQEYRAKGEGPRPTRPLERVEIDHTKLDVIVVDSKMRLPIGRPWLTLCIDVYSRSVLGMYISFEPPGYLSVMQCLLHAVKPKTYVEERYPDIRNRWEAYGIPEVLVADNGPEFHSAHLEDACLQLGIELQYAPPKRGDYKGSVERLFRTINQQFLHRIPGTTFSNVINRADYDPKKDAVISAEALEESAHKFIVDVYHQREHRALRDTPSNVWRTAIAEYPPSLPARSADLEVLLGCIERRTVSARGIELHSLFYNDEGLAKLRRKLGRGARVAVKYDPADLSKIYVADVENGEYIAVPAANQSYTHNLTLWQHKMIRRYAQKTRGGDSAVDLCLAKEDLQQIVEREYSTTKRTQTRQKMARFKAEEVIRPEKGLKHISSGGAGKRLPRSSAPDHGRTSMADIETAAEVASHTGAGNFDEEELDLTGWDADYDLPD